MIRIGAHLLAVALLGGLAACGSFQKGPEPTTQAPPVPPQFRGGEGGADVRRVSGDNPEEAAAAAEGLAQRDEGIVFLDPDNPEAGLSELSEVMSASATKGPWYLSFIEARKAAMRQGKPLVVWFTDTEKSGLCRFLSAEVFDQPEFRGWAEKEALRVRLDFNVEGISKGRDLTAEDDRLRKEDYLKKLKKRYKVLGLPTVLVMAPDGTVTGSYRGYERTYGEFYLDRMQKAAGVAASHHQKWVKKMEKRGYRVWTDNKGRTIFAKLLVYRDRTLILAEPDGNRLKARESNLSELDQQWIAAEKSRRAS